MGKTYRCDGPEDCSASEVCCNDKNGSVCTTSTCNGNGRFEVCHTTSDCSFSAVIVVFARTTGRRSAANERRLGAASWWLRADYQFLDEN